MSLALKLVFSTVIVALIVFIVYSVVLKKKPIYNDKAGVPSPSTSSSKNTTSPPIISEIAVYNQQQKDDWLVIPNNIIMGKDGWKPDSTFEWSKYLTNDKRLLIYVNFNSLAQLRGFGFEITGPVDYARVVLDNNTEFLKGTGENKVDNTLNSVISIKPDVELSGMPYTKRVLVEIKGFSSASFKSLQSIRFYDIVVV